MHCLEFTLLSCRSRIWVFRQQQHGCLQFTLPSHSPHQSHNYNSNNMNNGASGGSNHSGSYKQLSPFQQNSLMRRLASISSSSEFTSVSQQVPGARLVVPSPSHSTSTSRHLDQAATRNQTRLVAWVKGQCDSCSFPLRNLIFLR